MQHNDLVNKGISRTQRAGVTGFRWKQSFQINIQRGTYEKMLIMKGKFRPVRNIISIFRKSSIFMEFNVEDSDNAQCCIVYTC